MGTSTLQGKTAFLTCGASGIRKNRLYIVTHSEFKYRMRERAEALLDATPHPDMQF
jgi:hypothetical protein